MQIESFAQQGLQDVVPSYLYWQYSDDADLQAFTATYNGLAQGYLDWFNQTPLGLYTSANITGPLLDWTATGIYGISRPVVSTLIVSTRGGLSSRARNTAPLNTLVVTNSGTAVIASDDIYKRVLTWYLYTGNGRQMSIPWLRWRVARFLYGSNGGDVSASDLLNVQIKQPALRPIGAIGTRALNTAALNTLDFQSGYATHALEIVIPFGPTSQTFAALFSQGYLAAPFQVKFTVAYA